MQSVEIAAWQEANPHAFLAIELELPDDVTLRLTSGGTVAFDGKTFVPEHPQFGVFSFVGEFEDGEVGEATRPDIGFEPFTDQGFADLTAAEAQGSPFSVWWGLVDPATGAVIGTPVAYASGRLNVSRPSFGEGSRTLTLTTYTEEQFQLIFEGVTLADHSNIDPNDTTRKIYWRMSQPYPAGVASGGGAGGGGMGGGPGGGFLSRF
ncbi:MAG: hypothetical protein ACOC20_03430 [Oceanicaulis sp.]